MSDGERRSNNGRAGAPDGVHACRTLTAQQLIRRRTIDAATCSAPRGVD